MVRLNPTAAKKFVPLSAPQADKEAFAQPEIQAIDHEDLVEAYRNGAQGVYWEVVTLATPWGFSLKDIDKYLSLAWRSGYHYTHPHGKICGTKPSRLRAEILSWRGPYPDLQSLARDTHGRCSLNKERTIIFVYAGHIKKHGHIWHINTSFTTNTCSKRRCFLVRERKGYRERACNFVCVMIS